MAPRHPSGPLVLAALSVELGRAVPTTTVARRVGHAGSQYEIRLVREVLYALYMAGLCEKPMGRRLRWTLTTLGWRAASTDGMDHSVAYWQRKSRDAYHVIRTLETYIRTLEDALYPMRQVEA